MNETSQPLIPAAGRSLPAAAVAASLNEALLRRHAAVVVAPPGAGKSTLLPLTMLHTLPEGRIVMLEPRRIAARQVAMRMAQLLGEPVGQTVGYQIRFERKTSALTRIEVVTEGILTRRMTDDATLDGVSCIIFDEFHERSLQTDLALCLARQIRDILRPDLNLVIMSATIDAAPLSEALGAETVSCEGRMFPVETIQASDDTTPDRIAADVAAAVSRAHREYEGDILAFLPGQADITRCAALLGDSLAPTAVCPLYGNLPPERQYAAIAPSPAGQRKVVLATPIAETSVTIEGVRVVIDSGYFRKLVYDAATGLSHLETARISHDMARQRTGRAGRVAPGVCIRLWTTATDHRLDSQRTPEISGADLAPTVLAVAAFGETDVMGLPWLTPPPADSVRQAQQQLRLLGAIDADGRITPLGRRMAAMPCHPRIARMILHGQEPGRKALACDIAAILEEKDVMDANEAHASLLLRVTALRDARRNRRLGPWARIARTADEYARMAGIKSDNSYVGAYDIGALVASGWPGRVAQAVGHNGDFRLAGGGTAALEATDEMAGCPWLAVAALHAGSHGRGRIFLAAPVNADDLASLTTQYDNVTWITHQGGIIARREQRIGQLVVEARPLTDVPRDRLVAIVCAAVAKEGQSLLSWTDDTAALQLRVALVAKWHSELRLPDLTTGHLLGQPEAWLPFYLERNGRVAATVAELRKINMAEVLWNLLTYDQQQAVDRLAPTRIRVASGHLIKVRYRVGSDVPVLSVRLQECFGMTDTPTVDDGRVPVLMELLSPGFKPVQLTTDLRSFWQSTYFDVRKELRRRYPKHAWPEDPTKAVAR